MTYIVTSIRETGTITYHCRTTRSALEKVQDFQRAAYRDITVRTGEDRLIPEGQLALLDRQDRAHSPEP